MNKQRSISNNDLPRLGSIPPLRSFAHPARQQLSPSAFYHFPHQQSYQTPVHSYQQYQPQQHSYNTPHKQSRVVNLQQMFQIMLLMEEINNPPKKQTLRLRKESESSDEREPEKKRKKEKKPKRRTVLLRPQRKLSQPVIPLPIYRSQPSIQPTLPSINKEELKKQLQKLQSERAKRNLSILRNGFWYLQKFRRNLYNLIEEKKERTRNSMPEQIQKFSMESEIWCTKVLKPLFDSLPKINVQIVNQKITQSLLQKRIQTIKDTIRQIMVCLLNEPLTNIMVNFLTLVSCDREHLPDNYFLKYEINRLSFTYHGAIIKVTDTQRHMLYCTNLLIRILLLKVFPKNARTEEQKQNAKIIMSVFYDLVMTFIDIPVLPNNLKHIPIQFKIKERSPFHFVIDSFSCEPQQAKVLNNAKAQNLDKPILHPLYSELIPEDFVFRQSIFQLLASFCETIGEKVLANHKQLIKNRIDEFKKKKIADLIPSNLNQRASTQAKIRKQTYLKLCKDILDLKEKLK